MMRIIYQKCTTGLKGRVFAQAKTYRLQPQSWRSIHTSNGRGALPPILIAMAKPLARVAAMVVGRSARQWWKRLPQTEQGIWRSFYQNNRKKVYFAGIGLGAAFYYGYESHVEDCPVTGRRRFVALTPDQIKKIGRQEFRGLLEEFGPNILPERHPIYNRVRDVANRILHANKDIRQIYDKEWTVTIVDLPVKNAFVLPTGNIFVFTGMLEFCKNSDQLGVILSHEMAHAVLGHVQEKLTLASFVELVMLLPFALLWAFLPNDGIAIVANWFIDQVLTVLLELPFSRNMETEADEVGLFMAAKACFDVREAPAFWGRMQIISDDPMENDKDFEFISTHPCHSTRQDSLMALLTNALKLRFDCGCARLNPDRDPIQEIKAMKFQHDTFHVAKQSHSIR